jgi:crotonobetaine/carnitine-CoA ligase
MRLTDQLDATRRQSMHGMDIPWMLRQWADRSPDDIALIWEPFSGSARSWTYAQLRDAARSLASGLSMRGVRPGGFVIIHLDNSPEFVISWYACAELGAVAVSTNTRSVARDLSYFAGHTDAVAAITQPSFARLVARSCADLDFIVVTDDDAGEAPDEHHGHGDDGRASGRDDRSVAFTDVVGDPAHLPALECDPMRNLGVQFTSGTTSRPKAVLWTHANGLWAGRISAAHMRLRRDDVGLAFLPLFHTNAQAYSMLATHWSGGTLVVQPRFSASRFWDVSVKNRVTWCSTIPFAIKAIMDRPVPEHNYRFWGTAAHVPNVAAHFGIETLGWWGMTETLTQGIVTDPDHPGPHATIGRVAPEYDIQIRRADGTLADPGEKGHLFIRGVRGISLFMEYYGNPGANTLAFDDDGWFDTGDVIRIDDDGWLFFSDRDKDMLKVGAENVAASEIESVIMQTRLVDECAVVAQKHYMLDEVPVAFVIPSSDRPADEIAAAIIAHCRENLADFKVVHEVRVVDSLPRSTLEKIAKNELRALLPEITG